MSNYNNANKDKPMSDRETVPTFEISLKEQELARRRHAKIDLEVLARAHEAKANDYRGQAGY